LTQLQIEDCQSFNNGKEWKKNNRHNTRGAWEVSTVVGEN
jgi:hypothetical protein